ALCASFRSFGRLWTRAELVLRRRCLRPVHSSACTGRRVAGIEVRASSTESLPALRPMPGMRPHSNIPYSFIGNPEQGMRAVVNLGGALFKREPDTKA